MHTWFLNTKIYKAQISTEVTNLLYNIRFAHKLNLMVVSAHQQLLTIH